MKKLFVTLTASILLLWEPQTPLAKQHKKKNTKAKNFLTQLFHEKRYFDAIGEAERLQFYQGKNSLQYFINLCYFRGGQFFTVINNVRGISSRHGRYFDLKELQTLSYINVGEYEKAYRNSLSMKNFSQFSLSNRERLFRMRAMPLMKARKTAPLLEEIALGENYLGDSGKFPTLRHELMEFTNLKLKSPAIAALSSAIIPGSGQIYSGSYMGGVISLISVGATLLGGLVCHKRGEPGYGNTLFGFSALFYCGNIYGAWNSAETYNGNKISFKEKRIEKLWANPKPGEGITVEELLR